MKRVPYIGDYDAPPDGTILSAPIPDAEAIESYVRVTLSRLSNIVPDDNLYAQGTLAYAASIANYWPSAAQDQRVKRALADLQTRYQFVRSHYPGTTVLPEGSTLPSGSSARAPIVIAYNDGSFGYAPGYGPIGQFGAMQVPSSSVPPSDRVSAYDGKIVSKVGDGDIGDPLVGATPGSGTWGGIDPTTGPGYSPNAPPPPAGYPGAIVSTSPAVTPGMDGSLWMAVGIGVIALSFMLLLGGRR